MSFKRINNITGWVVFLIATAVYVLTAEKNGSLWDCGEFVASCFKLQIPHPPGAPLFVILGRIFIVLFGDNPATAAKAVNVMSALASSFTILFLFWTITHFARKLVNPVVSTLTGTQLISIMGAGAVGALAYTFSDSFWYSAVEGEVYALSSFFTALVFWAMLKWEQAVDADSATDGSNPSHFNADRWIVFIFFMMGLSIGVHLLNLLTIPAIVMIYYFKRYKVTNWGTFWAFVVGCVITGFVQKVVIQYSINGAGLFDRIFVNNFGLPFFSGFAVFFVLLAVGLWFALRTANKKGWYYLRLGVWCTSFMLIGYSSYLTTMIRSSADPGVDMYNVDNPMSLEGYLGREQYGDFPLVYGQVFTAQQRNIQREDGKMRYQKSKDKYIEIGNSPKDVYPADDLMFFPRVWDRSNDQQHANYYAEFLGIGINNDPKTAGDPDTGPYERRPSFGDNLKFFIGYQTYWMYFRYFMWNFAGKQNDVQGVSPSNVRDGNWITGISFVDNLIYGDQSKLPETLKENKAHNKLLALPLMLGLVGLFFHYRRNRRDFIVNMLLFFFTGMAIVLYLNQAGNQPRERDYAYVGSFYAFAVWIGLAVPALVQLAVEKNLKLLQSIAISAGIVYLVTAIAAFFGSGEPNAFAGLALLGVVATLLTFGLYYVLSAAKGERNIAMAAVFICAIAAPIWMASQEWDDHDRSQKTTAPDLAKNYLESCAPNAVLFSFGDNDTYPLWYAQEVQGVRPDVRVINYSLLGIDWYINQLRYKVNSSAPMDVIWSAEQIEGDKLNFAVNMQQETRYADLYSTLKDWVGTADPAKMYNNEGDMLPILPTNKFFIPVDKALVLRNGTVAAKDSAAIADSVKFDIGGRSGLLKNDLAVLAVIASSKWQRPIYFTSRFDELGFQNYLRRDGLTYRLVPVANQEVNTEWAYEKMMKQFAFGSAEKKGLYFDEENRRHLNSIRQAYGDVAVAMVGQNKKEEARNLLNRVDKMMLESNMPYGLVSRYNMHNQTSLMLLEAAYRAEDKALAKKIGTKVRKDLNEQMAYYTALGDRRAERMGQEVQRTQMMLQMLDQMETYLKQQSPEAALKINDSGSLPSTPMPADTNK